MRKTKIICTLVPASSSAEKITELLHAGMDTARVNFSHGTYDEQQEKIEHFRKARAAAGIPAALFLDTKGPEIRLGEFKDVSVYLETGQKYTFSCADMGKGDSRTIGVSYKGLCEKVKVGDIILNDDGKIKLQVDRIQDEQIICDVINGGKVSDRKSVNVPGIAL